MAGNNKIGGFEDQSQSYMVSVSDLMAGLLFLFIITIMVFALSLKEAEQKKDQEVKALRANKEARNEMLTELEQSLQDAGIEVVIDLQQGILRLPEEVLFASGQAKLDKKGKKNIKMLAIALATVLPCYVHNQMDSPHCKENNLNRYKAKIDAVFIEGHTDDVRISRKNKKFDDNWELSTSRSIETFKQLKHYGEGLVSEYSGLVELANSQEKAIFSVSGYADQRPVVDNVDKTTRSRNRRIDLRFIMEPPETEPEPEPIEKTREHLKP